MYKYKVQIKKVSGRLNESVLPKKNLVIKSRTKKSRQSILDESAKYLFENYGLKLIDARVILEAAPRLDSKYSDEIESAEAAQSNHFIQRHQDPANWGKRGTLERLRDEITKELVDAIYYKAGREVKYYNTPYGIAISLDGDVRVYGSSGNGHYNKDNATKAAWHDQSFDADEKASDNVFTYDFDEEDFSSLINFRHNLDNEISYGDYDEDDYNDEDEMYESMRWYFDDCIDSMERAMEKVKSFKDIEKCKQDYSTTKASDAVFDELRANVMNVIKDYMRMNKNKAHSMMGMKKMEEEEKPVRKQRLQKERFTIEDLLELCKNEGKFDGREYDYSGYRTTPDGREYQLKVSSVATGGRRIWVWTGSPSVKWSAKAVALYDAKTKTWQKKRNNFIEIVD